MKKLSFAHPFLFALTSIIYHFLLSSWIVSPDQVVRPLLVFWGVLIIMVLPSYWLVRDWGWTSVMLSVIAVTLFSSSEFFQAEIISIGAASIFWFGYCFVKKYNLKSYHLVNILNLVSTVLFLVVLWGVLMQSSGEMLVSMPYFHWDDRERLAVSAPSDALPDIYYIVLDGYGREDILGEYYKFDNSDVVDYLESRSFVVPANVRSNYHRTVLSISSTLNMNYISELVPELQNRDTYYWWLLTPLIDHSDVREMLETVGYRSYSIATGWSITDNPTTDVYYQPSQLVIDDFESYMLSVTPLRILFPYLSRYLHTPTFDKYRELILYNFTTLSEISKESDHKFVFAHITSPHPPFVFGENGESLTPSYRLSYTDGNYITLTDDEYRVGYVNQTKYLNKKIEALVDDILKNSNTPPIIIFQADHGPGMLTDFRSSADTCLRERFSPFAAYYLPGVDPNDIPQDITPVNLFRIVFNEYFGTDFALLPNNYYYSKDAVYLFRSEDVTPIVDTCTVE